MTEWLTDWLTDWERKKKVNCIEERNFLKCTALQLENEYPTFNEFMKAENKKKLKQSFGFFFSR